MKNIIKTTYGMLVLMFLLTACAAPAVVQPAATAAAPAPTPKSAPVPQPERAPQAPAPTGDSKSPHWAEPEVIEGSGSAEQIAKRKRKRRRKGKGGAGQNSQPHAPHADQSSENESPPPRPTAEVISEQTKESPLPPKPQGPRISYDPTAVSKMAWKLYQGEIGEEGIALIDDHDARDLARRCFRLAEIFLDEQSRRAR